MAHRHLEEEWTVVTEWPSFNFETIWPKGPGETLFDEPKYPTGKDTCPE